MLVRITLWWEFVSLLRLGGLVSLENLNWLRLVLFTFLLGGS